jgi:uncharacterized protein YdaU (DUF1376 family)
MPGTNRLTVEKIQELTMAKKINKLMARVTALEKSIAEFFATQKPVRKNKKKTAKKIVKKKAKKAVRAAAPKKAVKKIRKPETAKTRKSAVSVVAKKPGKPKAKKRVAPPTSIAQIAPSGLPDFVQPLDKV